MDARQLRLAGQIEITSRFEPMIRNGLNPD